MCSCWSPRFTAILLAITIESVDGFTFDMDLVKIAPEPLEFSLSHNSAVAIFFFACARFFFRPFGVGRARDQQIRHFFLFSCTNPLCDSLLQIYFHVAGALQIWFCDISTNLLPSRASRSRLAFFAPFRLLRAWLPLVSRYWRISASFASEPLWPVFSGFFVGSFACMRL